MPKALEGIHILDLTQFEAGPACTEYLAFLGADVVKIEQPGSGDQGRKSSRDKEAREKNLDSWFFIFLNANKRSATLNLKSEEGVALFKNMVKKADVVISNFKLGTMDKLGIGYKALSKVNKGIVYVECSGFGRGGPYESYPAFDPVAKAAGGVMSNTGYPDGPPVNPGPYIGDTGAGIHMAAAILAAIIYRNKTGEGQQIDMSMTENVINQNRSLIANTVPDGKPAPRLGNRPPHTPSGLYRCKGNDRDDYVYITGVNHYTLLMKHIGREDLLGELVDSLDKRDERYDEITQAIESWTLQRTKMEVFHSMAQAGVPCGPVLNSNEVLNDPHFNRRGFIVTMEHPIRGKYRMPGCPVKMSQSNLEYIPPPLLGQHTEEVYAEWLGLTGSDIDRLKEKKVI